MNCDNFLPISKYSLSPKKPLWLAHRQDLWHKHWQLLLLWTFVKTGCWRHSQAFPSKWLPFKLKWLNFQHVFVFVLLNRWKYWCCCCDHSSVNIQPLVVKMGRRWHRWTFGAMERTEDGTDDDDDWRCTSLTLNIICWIFFLSHCMYLSAVAVTIRLWISSPWQWRWAEDGTDGRTTARLDIWDDGTGGRWSRWPDSDDDGTEWTRWGPWT